MARTTIAAQTTPGAYPTLPVAANSRDLAVVPADVGNGNDVTIVEGKTLLVAYNASAATARTLTLTSVADAFGRSGDITAYSMAAGEIAIFGPFKVAGWSHAGKLWVDGSHAEMTFAVITLP